MSCRPEVGCSEAGIIHLNIYCREAGYTKRQRVGGVLALRDYGRIIAGLWEDHYIHRQNQARGQGAGYMSCRGYGAAPDGYLLCQPTDHPPQQDRALFHLF